MQGSFCGTRFARTVLETAYAPASHSKSPLREKLAQAAMPFRAFGFVHRLLRSSLSASARPAERQGALAHLPGARFSVSGRYNSGKGRLPAAGKKLSRTYRVRDFRYPVGTSRGSGRLPAAGKNLSRTYRVRDFLYPVGTNREKAACRQQARSSRTPTG